MRFFALLWILFSIIELSFAQKYPVAVTPELPEPILENKNLTTRNLPLHPIYDVLSYDIYTHIFPDSEKIEARTSIHIVMAIDTESELSFDFTDFQIDSVFMDSVRVQSTLQGELLMINPEAPLAAGDTHVVRIHYQGRPEKGLYFRSNFYGDLVIYSHNEPYDAHFWFPCKDDPSDKAKLTMTIDIPAQFTVLSNGKLVDKTAISPQNMRYIWQEDYPIATYLISIAAGSYLITTNTFSWYNKDLLLEYYVYPLDLEKGEMALQWVIEMFNFYSSFIGEYPFLSDKYSMAEAPFLEAAAMENQTATTMRDIYMDNEGIIAHELAHQWWGNALTPYSFIDIWLNEGFASYFDALFTEYKYGQEAFLLRMEEFKTYIFSDGSLPYPVYNPPADYMFGRAVYFKGAWILHMLRSKVGDQLFQEIIREYYQDYNYLNVTTGLFFDIVESVTGQSFSTFFRQWLNYGGIPILFGSWKSENNSVEISISQEQPEPVYQFALEVLIEGIVTDTLVILPIANRESQLHIPFNEPVSKIILDPNRKILSTTNSPVYNIPAHSGLVSLYPNPFMEKITITYQIEKSDNVEIMIYDVLGQIVENLLDKKMTIGIHQIEWDGRVYSSGIYFCVMKIGASYDVRKISLIK